MKKRFTPLFLASILTIAVVFNSCEEEEKPIISVPAVLENVPIADFTVERNFLEVTLDANTSENAKTYSWNFGDGSDGASGASVTHTFDKNGDYNIILTVANLTAEESAEQEVKALVDTETMQIMVRREPIEPVADFSFAIEDVKVTFTDLSVDAATYAWDFGVEGIDNDTSISKSPIYTYSESGTYTVTLTVKSIDDLESTVTKEVTVIKPVVTGPTFRNGTFDEFDASGETPNTDPWRAIRDMNNDDWVAPSALQTWIRTNPSLADATVTAGMSTSKNDGAFALKLEGLQRRAYQQIPVENGKSYKISFFGRSDAPVDNIAHMRAYVFGSEILDEETLDTNLGTADVLGSNKKYVEYTLIFTATTDIAVFYLRTLDGIAGYLDDINIEITEAPSTPSQNLTVNGTFDEFDASGATPNTDPWRAIRDMNNDDWVAPSALQTWIRANPNLADATVTAGMTTSENMGTFALKLNGIQRRAYQEIVVESGVTYRVTFFSRTDTPVDNTAHMRAYILDAEILDEDTLDTNLGTVDIVGSDRKYQEYTFEFTATTNKAIFYLRTLDTIVGYLDDVTIEKK